MWFGWWVIAGGASADEPVSPTAVPDLLEYNRLSEELERLASKNAWAGVERTFQQILATGAALSFEDWYRGAQSARTVGDVLTTRERLTAAAGLREDRAVVEWLWDIDTRFSGVLLACDPGSNILLSTEEAPFDPDVRRAVEFAVAAVRSECMFEGLLPAGTYRFFDREFKVQPRVQTETIDLRGIEVDRKTRRKLKRDFDATVAGSD